MPTGCKDHLIAQAADMNTSGLLVELAVLDSDLHLTKGLKGLPSRYGLVVENSQKSLKNNPMVIHDLLHLLHRGLQFADSIFCP
jgi:hypothetical protein